MKLHMNAESWLAGAELPQLNLWMFVEKAEATETLFKCWKNGDISTTVKGSKNMNKSLIVQSLVNVLKFEWSF